LKTLKHIGIIFRILESILASTMKTKAPYFCFNFMIL